MENKNTTKKLVAVGIVAIAAFTTMQVVKATEIASILLAPKAAVLVTETSNNSENDSEELTYINPRSEEEIIPEPELSSSESEPISDSELSSEPTSENESESTTESSEEEVVPEPESSEEEPEEVLPSLDPEVVYSFKDIRALIKEYPEQLNGSYVTLIVRVAGAALGVPGCCFFTDIEDTIISRPSQITQTNMSEMLVRFDEGNNNAGFSRTEITTISGNISYEYSTYLGVNLFIIK